MAGSLQATRLVGLVIRAQSGFYIVQTADGNKYTCQLRGRLKKGRVLGDIVAVGDQVEISADGETGSIDAVLPRHSELARMDPTPRGFYRQIILANADQAVLVFACADPDPHLRMLDRYLVIAEKESLPAVIVANKVDLIGLEKAKRMFGHYVDLGYSLVYASTTQNMGIDALQGILRGKVTALAGPSGVGKTSLLNCIQPGLGLTVMNVSQTTGKGRHTTVVRELYPLGEGGYVADTPGMKSLALWDTQPEELDGYFRELSSLVSACQFNDCTHVNEPGCAVRAAVEEGKVHPERYQSYLRLRDSSK